MLELYSEHMPAKIQFAVANNLRVAAQAKFTELGFNCNSVTTYITPRRLVLAAEGLPSTIAAKQTERRGPRTSAPESSVNAFAQSLGLEVSALAKRKTDKGEFFFADIVAGGGDAAELLQPIIEDLVKGIAWPKTMRWGEHSLRWVRPLRRILAVFDGKNLPLQIGHLQSGVYSSGHAVMALPEFKVSNFQDYHENLRQRYVIIEHEERVKIILNEAKQLGEQHYLHFQPDQHLIEELAGLSEWPAILLGRINTEFMHLPAEILVTSMKLHQKYLPLHTKQGELAPFFVMVADITSTGDMSYVIAGNERVLRARLSDAMFFWNQDCKQRLIGRLSQLERVLFHAQLGTMREKAERIASLATFLAFWVPRANLRYVERAGLLCKADLVTAVVGEFPELQGIMGYYYAKHDQEERAVAQAILDHYHPVGPDAPCPKAPESIAVAIADKVDTLMGLFLIQEKPTGSKDPFALRRAALGVIRLILENKLRMPLRVLFDKAFNIYPSSVHTEDERKLRARHKRVVRDLLSFFYERLKVVLKNGAVRHDVIQSLFEVYEPDDDLTRVVEKAEALEAFLRKTKPTVLLAFKRVSNILKEDGVLRIVIFRKHASEDKLEEKEEFELYEHMDAARQEVLAYIQKEDYPAMLATLAKLAPHIHHFLDKVKVNADKAYLRKNRIRILAELHEILYEVYNFDVIGDA